LLLHNNTLGQQIAQQRKKRQPYYEQKKQRVRYELDSGQRIDWMIKKSYLEIEYTDRLPMLVFRQCQVYTYSESVEGN